MNKNNNIYYILTLAFVLRLLSLHQSFWLDEATSAGVARDLSLYQILNDFLPGDFHPAGYYLLLKGWGAVFGFSTVALRLSSVCVGVATVFVVYLIGKTLKNETLGTLSALLFATAPLHIYYSQEVRMYSLSTLLASLTIYFYLRIQKRPNKTDWLWFSTFLASNLLIDYLPVLIIIPIWAATLFGFSKRKAIWKRNFLLSHVPALLAFGVLWPILKTQLAAGLSVKISSPAWWSLLGTTNFKNIALIPVKFLIGRISFENDYVYVLMAVSALALYVFAFKETVKKINNYKILYLWATLPVIAGVFIGLFIPVLSYFRFLFVLPVVYLLAALGLTEIKEKYFVPLLFSLFLLNMTMSYRYLSTPKFLREDWRGLATYISEDSVFMPSPLVIFPANSQMEALKFYNSDGRVQISGPDIEIGSQERLYLIRYVVAIFDPEDKVRTKIESNNYQKVEEKDFNGITVWKYEKLPEIPPELELNSEKVIKL